MDDWEKFSKMLLPEKENSQSLLNIKDTADADYVDTKRVCKGNEKKKKIGECHDLYIQNCTLLLAEVLENFRNICLKICKLDFAKFISAPGLASQTALKKAKVKLELLTDIDMLLIVEKGIGVGICHSIYRYEKSNNKYMKDYDKDKESSYIRY